MPSLDPRLISLFSVLVIIAGVCIPVMMFCKPLFILYRHKKQQAYMYSTPFSVPSFSSLSQTSPFEVLHSVSLPLLE